MSNLCIVILFIVVNVGLGLAQPTTTPIPTCEEITFFMRYWWLVGIVGLGVGIVLAVILTCVMMRRQAAATSQYKLVRPVIAQEIHAPFRQGF